MMMTSWRHHFLPRRIHHCGHGSSCQHRMIQRSRLQFLHHRLLVGLLLHLTHVIKRIIHLRHHLNALMWPMINIWNLRVDSWGQWDWMSSLCPVANLAWPWLFKGGFGDTYLFARLFKDVIGLVLRARWGRWGARPEGRVWVLASCLWSSLIIVVIKSWVDFLDNVHV